MLTLTCGNLVWTQTSVQIHGTGTGGRTLSSLFVRTFGSLLNEGMSPSVARSRPVNVQLQSDGYLMAPIIWTWFGGDLEKKEKMSTLMGRELCNYYGTVSSAFFAVDIVSCYSFDSRP